MTETDGFTLAVIVPVSKMFGRMQKLETYLKNGVEKGINFYIIHDVQDDITSDQLNSIIDSIASSRIKIHEEFFGSPGGARNLGISLAKEDWIAFWDSDDVPEIDSFWEMVSLAELNGCQVAVGNYLEIDLLNRVSVPKCNLSATSKLTGNDFIGNPGIWRWAFQKSVIKNFKFPETSMGEDQIFLLGLLKNPYRVYKYFHPVYKYTTDDPSQLTRNQKSFTDSYASAKKILSAKSIGKYDTYAALRILVSSIRRGKKISNLPFLFLVTLLHVQKTCSAFIKSNQINSNSSDENLKTNVRLICVGGIGNQIFQISGALSIFPDHRILTDHSLSNGIKLWDTQARVDIPKVKIQEYQGNQFNYLQKKMINAQLRGYENSDINPKLLALTKRISSAILNISLLNKYEIYSNESTGYQIKEIPRSKKPIIVIGYFQSHKYCTNFATTKEIIERIVCGSDHESSDRNPEFEEQRRVLVQIRLGDYKLDELIGTLKMSYFLKICEEVLKSNESSILYAYSDEIDKVLPILKSKFPNTVCGEPAAADPIEILRNMRKFRTLIISNSTFGFWAAYFNVYGSTDIYTPDPWFKVYGMPKNLIPPTWKLRTSEF